MTNLFNPGFHCSPS